MTNGVRVLVLAEHNQQELSPATARLITAAQSFGLPVDLLVAGSECKEVGEQARFYEGVSHILLINEEQLHARLAEDMTACLLPLMRASHDILLVASNAAGRELVPRLAALLDVSPLSDAVQIVDAEQFVRPLHAGAVLTKVKLLTSKKLMTVRPSSFPPTSLRGNDTSLAELVICDPVPLPSLSTQIGQEFLGNQQELEDAAIIIGIGRGAQDEESLALIEKLAAHLEAMIGGSRVAVELGMLANNEQIGQTGKTIAPKLYIALGISGAVQHLAGIRDAQVIIAINKDPDAPIFTVADYGLVGDLRNLLPDLLAALTS